MRRILLCGAQLLRAPQSRAFSRLVQRIKDERRVSEAINLSLARNRPERSDGGVTASSASSFIDGPARV
jgi:hypothetical protein